ncbi:MAG: aromatic ring-hydroxylating oxygenase subunit alpha [Burkholderiales bacterium]
MLMKNRIASFIDDRDGQFRVDRSVYLDEDLFNAEMAFLFEGGWVYLAHESQIREAGDYFSTRIGRQPVFVVRKRDGGIAAYINACAHRGATLVPFEHGKANAFVCRFHGWAFNHEGRCIKIKGEETGAYPEGDPKERYPLTPVARLESYRGFIFASLEPKVPTLKEWLGPTHTWIDLLADQSPQGLEVVRGASTYTVLGNWKLQAENGADGYHVSTVHGVFAKTVANRQEKNKVEGMGKTEAGRMTGNVNSGCYHFGNGHLGIWAQHTTPQVRPLWRQKDRLEKEFSPERVDWMLNRGRNLYLFPNVFIMDNPSSQIRTINPIAPGICEVTVRCVAPVGEAADLRAARLRKFEDFYLTSGMATSDDLAALEAVHSGGAARAARWNDFSRGMTAIRHGSEDTDGARIGLAPESMTPNWDHEALYHGFYRVWKERLLAGALA